MSTRDAPVTVTNAPAVPAIDTSTPAVPAWGGDDMIELIALDAVGPMHFRNRCGDANTHGRAFGGQILAQALMAAARTVEPARTPTMMQFLFLQGTQWAQAVDLHVAALQDGKRFSSRHVRGSQGADRAVLDAQVSFALPAEAPAHAAVPAFPADEVPETLPTLGDLPPAWGERIDQAIGYRIYTKAAIDFRLAGPPAEFRLDTSDPRLRFWLRLRHALPDDPVVHAAAFAYVSDWWLNFPAPGAHIDELQGQARLYVASLNHAIWLHCPLRADDWLHFETVSPAAADGRGLCVARVHDRSGRLVASATQECLMVPRDM